MKIPKPKKKALTPKEKIFVAEVLKPDVSQTDAYQALAPHVSRESARTMGARMMQKPHVQEHINAVLEKRYPEMARTAADVLMEYLQDPEIVPQVKLKCIEMLAKFQGWHSATKIDKREIRVDLNKYRLPGTGGSDE